MGTLSSLQPAENSEELARYAEFQGADLCRLVPVPKVPRAMRRSASDSPRLSPTEGRPGGVRLPWGIRHEGVHIECCSRGLATAVQKLQIIKPLNETLFPTCSAIVAPVRTRDQGC